MKKNFEIAPSKISRASGGNGILRPGTVFVPIFGATLIGYFVFCLFLPSSGGAEGPLVGSAFSLFDRSHLYHIASDAVLSVEFVALVIASFYLFQQIVFRPEIRNASVEAKQGNGDWKNLFRAGSVVRMGVPAPAVRRANRSADVVHSGGLDAGRVGCIYTVRS